MKKIVAILVVLFLVLFGNTTGRTEEQIVSRIRINVERMDNILQSPFAKTGLEMIVWNFYRARVDLAPNGYEMNNDFKQGFLQSYIVFKKRLWKGDFKELKNKIGDNYLNAMGRYYDQSRAKYLDFIRAIDETSYFPVDYSPDFILDSQLYFSLLLFDVEEDEWVKAKKFTYIFPFCDW